MTMFFHQNKVSVTLALFCLLVAVRICHAQLRVLAQRPPSQVSPGNDAAEFGDDDDFSEFDDDEFEHTPQRPDAKKLGKADLPPIPLQPVQERQQSAEKASNKPGEQPGSGQQNEAASKPAGAKQPAPADSFADEITVEVEDDDLDAEEFESDTTPPHSEAAQKNKAAAGDAGKSSSPSGGGADKGLKIAEVPVALQRRWINYTSEGLMLAIVIIYVTMYVTGRVINQRLATTWLEYHRDLLEQEFAFVGVPGDKLENVEEQESKTNADILHKEYDHVFTVWCTGRAGIDGMLIQLELLRRQDLVGSVIKLVRGTSDRVSFKALLEPTFGDNFVFAMVKKQQAAAYAKDMADLAYFCPERRPGDRLGIPESFSVMSEVGEVSTALFDREFVRMLNDYEHSIELLHISDRYIRTKQEEETALNAGNTPDTKKIILFTVKLPASKSSQDAMRDLVPVTQFFLYLLEKLNRFHLSREGKAKSDKNRATLQQRYIKATHSQRTEAAQQRKEDKRKAEKEKMLNENDPDKQRKWEEREYKRDMKKRGPKIKQMKVKSM